MGQGSLCSCAKPYMSKLDWYVSTYLNVPFSLLRWICGLLQSANRIRGQNYSINLLYSIGLAKSVSKIVYFYYHIASGVAALSDLAN
jgi:hypothetical protein